MFEQRDKQVVHNLKSWYWDPAMIGKHFLVYSDRHKTVKRHYTICNTMNTQVYQEVVKCIKRVTEQDDSKFDAMAFSDPD